MLMPSKHINFSQSLLGFGGYLLSKLNVPKDIDELWDEYLKGESLGNNMAKHTFDNMILTLVFLYGVNAITEENGKIKKCG